MLQNSGAKQQSRHGLKYIYTCLLYMMDIQLDEVEMEDYTDIDTSKCYCVAATEAQRFLEDFLINMGLLPNEIVDCIT